MSLDKWEPELLAIMLELVRDAKKEGEEERKKELTSLKGNAKANAILEALPPPPSLTQLRPESDRTVREKW